jgi:hypothetical protein
MLIIGLVVAFVLLLLLAFVIWRKRKAAKESYLVADNDTGSGKARRKSISRGRSSTQTPRTLEELRKRSNSKYVFDELLAVGMLPEAADEGGDEEQEMRNVAASTEQEAQRFVVPAPPPPRQEKSINMETDEELFGDIAPVPPPPPRPATTPPPPPPKPRQTYLFDDI